MMGVPFLGSVPIDPQFSEAADVGVPMVDLHPDSVDRPARSRPSRSGEFGQLPAKEVSGGAGGGEQTLPRVRADTTTTASTGRTAAAERRPPHHRHA